MATSKAVKIEYRKGPRKGESYVVASEALAKSVHPDATITGYESGESYKTRSTAKSNKPEPEGLMALTVPELQAMAKERDIAFSDLKKAELVAALEKDESSDTESDADGGTE